MAQGYLNLLSKSLSSQIVIQQYLHRKSYKVRISKSKAKEQNTCLLRSRFILGDERYVTRPERPAAKVTRKTCIWVKHPVKIQWLLCVSVDWTSKKCVHRRIDHIKKISTSDKRRPSLDSSLYLYCGSKKVLDSGSTP